MPKIPPLYNHNKRLATTRHLSVVSDSLGRQFIHSKISRHCVPVELPEESQSDDVATAAGEPSVPDGQDASYNMVMTSEEYEEGVENIMGVKVLPQQRRKRYLNSVRCKSFIVTMIDHVHRMPLYKRGGSISLNTWTHVRNLKLEDDTATCVLNPVAKFHHHSTGAQTAGMGHCGAQTVLYDAIWMHRFM